MIPARTTPGRPDLFIFARDLKWEQLIERCKQNPVEAHYRARNGYTALHMACVRSAPLSAINALLEADPMATKVQDSSGCTPLHIASIYASKEIVRVLIDADITAIRITNNSRRTPLEYFWWLNDAYFVRNEVEDALRSNEKMSVILERSKKLSEFWNKACMLARATYHGSAEEILPKGKSWRMLHACCGIENCPPSLFQFALKVYPDQVQQADEDGNLPLHLAATASGALEDVSNDLVKINNLLDAHSQAAFSRNIKGMFPLHLALQSGEQWNVAAESIFHAFPGVCTEIDKDSRLFPFMLAAVGRKSSLEFAYHLLLSCPELERFMGSAEGTMSPKGQGNLDRLLVQ